MSVTFIRALIPWVFNEHPLCGRHCDNVAIKTILTSPSLHKLKKTQTQHKDTGKYCEMEAQDTKEKHKVAN